MQGRPVWLASLSRRDSKGDILATGTWTPGQVSESTALLRQALTGVGDGGKERLFGMNITLCLHRGCTAQEVARLPAEWHSAQWGMAGVPVEVLWQNIPVTPASQPCEFPRRLQQMPGRPDLWLPEGCGVCNSCLARAALRQSI